MIVRFATFSPLSRRRRDRKSGQQMTLSGAGSSQVALLAHVPAELAETRMPCDEWLAIVLRVVQSDHDGLLGECSVITSTATDASAVQKVKSAAAAAVVRDALVAAGFHALAVLRGDAGSDCDSDGTLCGDYYSSSDDEEGEREEFPNP
jgi:hypothetical protein